MTALLVIIYLSFISLGLPDGILGAAWPVISTDLGAPVSFAGVLSMLVAGGTIISSLISDRVIRRFGTGLVTAVSVSLTALALVGFAFSKGIIWMIILAVPMGLGAGSVDTALNVFVALHYKARHMNWLHCSWGIGASAGPIIMSLYLARQGGWKLGYGTIGTIQVLLVIVLFAALPLWKKVGRSDSETQSQNSGSMLSATKTRGVKSAMFCFFAYCTLEITVGLWGSTYLVGVRGLSVETAARWVALFYLGITAGRFVSGFVSFKLTNTMMIRIGMVIISAGLLMVLLPMGHSFLQIGFMMMGIGCAPIFPGMLHETPLRFGKAISQKLVGLQMASAYVGTTLMPPIFGVAAQYIGISLFPYYLLAILIGMFLLFENMNRIACQNAATCTL